MTVHRGDIVIVDYPYADRVGSAVRPALIVQADDLNDRLNATVLAMITSSRNQMIGAPNQLIIESSHTDYAQSGLRTDSVIQCHILATIEQALIVRTIGNLSDQTMREINICLKAALGIP